MDGSGILTAIVGNEFAADDLVDQEWPEQGACLYVPMENEQSLIYQYAECLSVRAFLEICNLPFDVEQRPNVEQISPSGDVPFLRIANLIVADFLPIVNLVNRKGVKLSDGLPDFELADIQAYISLIHEKLRNSEIYICWLHEKTCADVTARRYGSVYPFPLDRFLTFAKKREIKHKMNTFGWAQKPFDKVLHEVDLCCRALSSKLGQKDFFSGDSPTELDALAFGHLYTIITTDLLDVEIASVVKRYQNLVDFCTRIDQRYFMRSKR